MEGIHIISPGFLTTVQDLGRFGYQQFGMSPSGAMDPFSLQLANILVGNARDEACFEMTFVGPEIEFSKQAVIALAGAEMNAEINGTPLSLHQSLKLEPGDVLRFGALKKGCRCYLAIRGGIHVEPVLGSKSTYLKAKIGGVNGRALKQGDSLALGAKVSTNPIYKKMLVETCQIRDVNTIHILPGPEANHLSQNGIRTFLTGMYQISAAADRMGYRLDGFPLERKENTEIISSGISLGTIQLPADGKPIILMADRQTTGGYPRIANVILADIPLLAQLKPGDKIRFKEVTMEIAAEKLKKQQQILEKVRAIRLKA